MDVWNQELNELNDHYRKALKSMESDKKKEVIELEKAAKEAARLSKEAEQKAKEERAHKRKMNKEEDASKIGKDGSSPLCSFSTKEESTLSQWYS